MTDALAIPGTDPFHKPMMPSFSTTVLRIWIVEGLALDGRGEEEEGEEGEEEEEGIEEGEDCVCILVFMSSVGDVMAAARPPLRVPAASFPPKDNSCPFPPEELMADLIGE